MNKLIGDFKLNLVQFSSQTADLNRLLTNFSEILDQEAIAIKCNQAEQLTQIIAIKEQLAHDLNLATDSINQFLNSYSVDLINFKNSPLFKELPTEIQTIVKNLVNLTQECNDKNLANGMSIQMLSNINKHVLDLISGKNEQQVKLYGSSGEQTQSGSKSSLGKA
jgi:flagellar biosynthesis/type III secretory pathway chaperone